MSSELRATRWIRLHRSKLGLSGRGSNGWFDTSEQLLAATPDRAAEERIYDASVVWGTEPEGATS